MLKLGIKNIKLLKKSNWRPTKKMINMQNPSNVFVENQKRHIENSGINPHYKSMNLQPKQINSQYQSMPPNHYNQSENNFYSQIPKHNQPNSYNTYNPRNEMQSEYINRGNKNNQSKRFQQSYQY